MSQKKAVRVLALHGSEGTADQFAQLLQTLWQNPAATDDDPNSIGRNLLLDLQITAVNAPFVKGRGYAWWSMPLGVRSFQADVYEGFDESADLVTQTLLTATPAFDLVVGFSQGAILVTALLALRKISAHPRLGYILIGGAWPNPFTKELESVNKATKMVGRVLMVVGERDQVNSPEQSRRVCRALEVSGGFQVNWLSFAGGHVVPPTDCTNDNTLESILAWIAQGFNDSM